MNQSEFLAMLDVPDGFTYPTLDDYQVALDEIKRQAREREIADLQAQLRANEEEQRQVAARTVALVENYGRSVITWRTHDDESRLVPPANRKRLGEK